MIENETEEVKEGEVRGIMIKNNVLPTLTFPDEFLVTMARTRSISALGSPTSLGSELVKMATCRMRAALLLTRFSNSMASSSLRDNWSGETTSLHYGPSPFLGGG